MMSEHNSRPGISAILIVYNEEKIIERCLKSLAGIVDEIIVIHDGECKDNTLTISRNYTDKIYIEPHLGESELHKIRALDYATCSWILRIDADEYLSEELRNNLRSLILDNQYDQYAFIWPIWNGKNYITKDVPYKDILFRKDKIYAIDCPHKTYSTYGQKKNVPLLLEHRPRYNNFSFETYRKKWGKWMVIQAIWTCRYKNIGYYNCSPEQIEAYRRKMENQIRFANPLLAPAWFLLSFLRFFIKLKSWKSLQLIKISMLQGLYAAQFCLELWKYKREPVKE